MTEDSAGWSFAAAREPARFAAALKRGSGGEHARGSDPTSLCGIPEAELTVVRRLFADSRSPDRCCPHCRELAAAAPVPCVQERLHDEVVTAPADPLRARLLDALRNGAEIVIWINGPARDIASYAETERITDGAGAVHRALDSMDHASVARIRQPGGEFVAVLTEHAVPVIAWATG